MLAERSHRGRGATDDSRAPRRAEIPVDPAATLLPVGAGRRRRVAALGGIAVCPVAPQAGRRVTRAAAPRAPRPAPGGLVVVGRRAWRSAPCRTNNPFLLLLIGAVVCFVVSVRRSSAPWSRSLAFFLRLGLLVIVIRVVIEILFGRTWRAGHVLFTLPHVPLPSWAAGGEHRRPGHAGVHPRRVREGLQIAVILLCFGAANSLASPTDSCAACRRCSTRPAWRSPWPSSFTPELVEIHRRRASGPPPARRPDRASAACAAWRCRCSRVRWTGRCSWPPPWTPAATDGGSRREGVTTAGRAAPRSAGCCWLPSGSTASSIRARSSGSAFRSSRSRPSCAESAWPSAGGARPARATDPTRGGGPSGWWSVGAGCPGGHGRRPCARRAGTHDLLHAPGVSEHPAAAGRWDPRRRGPGRRGAEPLRRATASTVSRRQRRASPR